MRHTSRNATLAGLVLAAACGGHPAPPEAPPPKVATVTAQTRRVEVSLPFVGYVESARSVQLVALVEGRVTRIGVADGARVRNQQTVFTLGGPRVQSRRKALEAAADAARQEQEAGRARLAQANRRAAAHLAAPGEVAAAKRAAAAAAAQHAAAESALERFAAAVDVQAPSAGSFIARTVSPGQDVTAGEVLGQVLAPGSQRVAAQVLPRAGLRPQTGQRAEVASSHGGPLATVVSAVQPVAGGAGTVQVWLTGRALAAVAPGTAVSGRIVVATRDSAVTVPTAAVVRDRDDRPLVFVASGERYDKRSITTGEEGPGWVEVTSGLEAGEAVVAQGAYELYWSSFGKEFKVAD